MKITVALAVFNEQENLKNCLDSVKDLADEIVIVDGGSSDKTVEVAKSFGAKILETDNPPIFHINKQKALDLSSGDWILQLDADETVSKKLAEEIKDVLEMSDAEIDSYEDSLQNKKLFQRHQKIIEQRDGKIGLDGPYAAFFIPRLNFFLGKYLKHGGVYPDGVIRLVKNGKASFPCKSVHEQMIIQGRVGWLQNNLLHKDSPTFKRYLERNKRYINLISQDFKKEHTDKNIFEAVKYLLLKPLWWFLVTQIRHKGVLDGYQGVVFSFFSALRFPRAYVKYLFEG